jgi:hypothetical protein
MRFDDWRDKMGIRWDDITAVMNIYSDNEIWRYEVILYYEMIMW